ncbi:hypothetical protein FACS1894188_10680 [Clostridia bacterium]|nr:hypothetical protein FACS1894188_10680 [Clostridia bacterium]
MTLFEFAEMTVTAMGGVIEPIEFALCAALIPDEYKDKFQGKSELLLAFDYDVAQENPESEFVTYGSYIFDELLEIARTSAKCVHRYVNADRLEVADAETKIKRWLGIEAGIVNVLSQDAGIGLWAVFNFSAQFIADETIEQIFDVCVNLLNGKVDDSIISSLIPFDEDSSNVTLPYFECIEIDEAYNLAYREAENYAHQKPEIQSDKTQITKETGRISRYYDELISENKRRTMRKGVSAEKLAEIDDRGKTLSMEKDKQIAEITEKLTTKIVVTIENVIVYHVPQLRFLRDNYCKMNKFALLPKRLFSRPVQ